MSRSVFRQLVLKDLYLVRWMVAGSVVAGAIAQGVMPLSSVSAYVGGVSLICTIVILNIFLVMSSVVQERKDKVLLFVLSLPISPVEYMWAKVTSNAIAFGVPWLLLTIGAVFLVDRSQIPNGLLPFWLAVLVYLLAYFCVLLAVALVTDSTGWHATTITIGNISVNFLIPFLLSLPSVVKHNTSPTAVWTPDMVAIIGIEILVGIAALCLGIYLRSRAPDFV